jgi:hypothetical protein
MRCLNAPPHVLLSALSVLQAEHYVGGSRVIDILTGEAQKYPQKRSLFAVPVSGGRRGGGEELRKVLDRLYQPD